FDRSARTPGHRAGSPVTSSSSETDSAQRCAVADVDSPARHFRPWILVGIAERRHDKDSGEIAEGGGRTRYRGCGTGKERRHWSSPRQHRYSDPGLYRFDYQPGEWSCNRGPLQGRPDGSQGGSADRYRSSSLSSDVDTGPRHSRTRPESFGPSEDGSSAV